MMKSGEPQPHPWLAPVAALLLACLGVLACATEGEVPVHGWWNERGPVVRHEDFPADCTLCHMGMDWNELVPNFEFDHEKETGHELEGAHLQAKCLRCHNDRGPVQVFERQGCAGCHTDEHEGQLGRDCRVCHEQMTWAAVGPIAEHRRTRFPLTGTHLTTACWRCHERAELGDFSGEDPRCVACHVEELASALDPDHGSLGWDRNCERCHYPSTWGGAGFRHATLASNCIECHFEDYQTAVQPPHTAAEFPTDCTVCHINESWSPAMLDHPYPLVLIHGLFTCDQCHVRIGNFQQFSCLHCHWHELRIEEVRHKNVKGYVWSEPHCIACHPTGH